MKKNHMLFSILFFIYAGGGVVSLIMFGMTGSYLSRKQTAPTAVVEQDISENATVEPLEVPTGNPVEAPADESVESPAKNSDNTLTSDTPKPEESSEPSTEATDDSDASMSDESASDPTVKASGSSDETDSSENEEAAKPEKTYYAFTVIDGVTDVCIRETDARYATILSHIDGGNSGYVLEKGDTRTKILTKKGTIGYIYNEYITISEIPMNEFPEEYR